MASFPNIQYLHENDNVLDNYRFMNIKAQKSMFYLILISQYFGVNLPGYTFKLSGFYWKLTDYIPRFSLKLTNSNF